MQSRHGCEGKHGRGTGEEPCEADKYRKGHHQAPGADRMQNREVNTVRGHRQAPLHWAGAGAMAWSAGPAYHKGAA